jgi:hypothetical protein
MVKIGDKIKIINMKGEDHYSGREGVIEYIDGLDQLHGTWGGLAVIPGEDEFEVIQKACVICGQPIDGHGNNPMPLKGDSCCDACNLKLVVPLRIFWNERNHDQAMILGEDNSIQFIKPQNLSFTLEQLQKAVNGYIEVHPHKVPKHLILVNEEGILMKMKSNRLAELAFDIKVVGPALICPSKLME